MPYSLYRDSRVFYEITGGSRPLLYLHGWNGSMKSFKDCLSHELKKDFQLIMLDLPGFGRSEPIPLSFAAVSEIIDQILTRNGIDRVRLMGFCMGGAFALDFAIRYPHRVASMILVETSFHFPWIMLPVLLPGFGRLILRFFLLHPIGAGLARHYLLLSGHRYREEFYPQFQKVDPKISLAYMKLLFAYSRVGHNERIGTIRANTKIIIGKYTSRSIRGSAKMLGRLIKNSKILLLENCRHFPLEENSAGLMRSLRPGHWTRNQPRIPYPENDDTAHEKTFF